MKNAKIKNRQKLSMLVVTMVLVLLMTLIAGIFTGCGKNAGGGREHRTGAAGHQHAGHGWLRGAQGYERQPHHRGHPGHHDLQRRLRRRDPALL